MLRTPWLAVLLSCPLATAQVVVPASYRTSDARSLGWFPGAPRHLRQQILVGAAHLTKLRGKTIHELWLRRDASDPVALQGGAVDVRVWLSTSTSLDPARPSARFDANHGRDRALVLQGRVPVPNSPAPGPGYDPWAPANVVRLVLARPFRYGGGTLSIDWVGAAAPGKAFRFWPLDYHDEAVAGVVRRTGTSCTRVPFGSPYTADADARSLVPGATALFTAVARPRTTGYLLLGTRLLAGAQGISLAPFGAPACRLYVDPAATLTTSFGPALEQGAPAHGVVRVSLPGNPTLLGASVVAQWAVTEWRAYPPSGWTNRAGLTTSNLVQATLAARSAQLDLATVTRSVTRPPVLPVEGTVRVGRGPVLRLVAR